MPDQHYRTAYPKLSSFYFFYFMLFGALIPYIGLYYQSLGFNAIQIGQLMAVFVGTKIVAPNVLGWLSDRTGETIRWLRWTAFLTLLFSFGLIYYHSFIGLLLTVFGFSFFFHAALPLFESYTFRSLSGVKERYGLVRLWGSVGFIVAVLWVGWQIDVFSIQTFPWLLCLLALIIWLATFWVKEQGPMFKKESTSSFLNVVKQPWVASLLIVSVLIQFSHGTYYSFYSIFLSDYGYSKTTISWLWAVGVIAEIAVFFWMVPLFRIYSVKFLLMLSLALTLLRWVMIPLVPESLPLLLFAQTLHAASYGLFHAAAIYLIDHHFRGDNQSKGQAIYASASHGVGGALGMLIAGYAWHDGGAYLAFGISAISIILAIIIAQKWIESSQNEMISRSN
ncbi:MFS transporter [Hydrogenovibrio sp. 3SP14C1]|uniref:MFS transporter n=1 Tax=Hydrogenovibrio sp. 3SP14C1 TaxID=3038774 RepID=UPI002417EEFB|nr:MFS transporter [Hydrogenovibrio sp. 3SP14C1]MDG4813361.1 MFS transporter [Hydrogenovibrio sp. 3SP14C1]